MFWLLSPLALARSPVAVFLLPLPLALAWTPFAVLPLLSPWASANNPVAVLPLLAPWASAKFPIATFKLLSPLALAMFPNAAFELLPEAEALVPQATLVTDPVALPPAAACGSPPFELPPHINCARAGAAKISPRVTSSIKRHAPTSSIFLIMTKPPPYSFLIAIFFTLPGHSCSRSIRCELGKKREDAVEAGPAATNHYRVFPLRHH